MKGVEDTGCRRRVIDQVSTDDCLELVCTLAYEKALEGEDQVVISQVERAMLRLRSLKVEPTGAIPILTPFEIECLMDAQEAEGA